MITFRSLSNFATVTDSHTAPAHALPEQRVLPCVTLQHQMLCAKIISVLLLQNYAEEFAKRFKEPLPKSWSELLHVVAWAFFSSGDKKAVLERAAFRPSRAVTEGLQVCHQFCPSVLPHLRVMQ